MIEDGRLQLSQHKKSNLGYVFLIQIVWADKALKKCQQLLTFLLLLHQLMLELFGIAIASS